MAVVRNTTQLNNSVDYVSTLALFVCVSTVITMLKFLGFKASLNFNSGRNETNPDATTVSVTGAYRVNRDEFLDDIRNTKSRDIRSPPMTRPPTNPTNPNLRPNKSSSDLAKQKNLPAHLSKSSHDISFDPRGGASTQSNTNRNTTIVVDEKNQAKLSKEQIKLEKKRLAEQKAREKAAAQEQAKQEKIRKEQEKQEARQRAKEQANAKNKKKVAPAAPPAPPPPPNNNRTANPTSSYSTNTMQSSISTTSGPPPYSERSKPQPETVNSSTPNVMFSKPIDDSSNSWDLISQHRQQMSKPVSQGRPKAEKKMVMDLQYKLGDDNSEV